MALLERYDACLRLDATCPNDPEYLITDSSGADGEVKKFLELDRPVFMDKQKLYDWVKTRETDNT